MVAKLTLKDVAAKIGVSTATISNAFSRPDQLSAGLRQKILSECEAMGYYGPNAAARSLRTGRTGIIGVVLSDRISYSVTDPVASHFLEGVGEVLDRYHYNLLLLSAGSLEAGNGSARLSFMGDGLILYGLQHCQPHGLRLPTKNVVTVDFTWEDFPSVTVDNRGGARQVASHAFAHKPNRVAVLGLRMLEDARIQRLRNSADLQETTPVSYQRWLGFMDAAENLGVDIPASNIWHVPENIHHYAYQAARDALSLRPRPDLLLCMSDRIALAAIQAVMRLGLKVPEDVKVVGFDGISAGANFHPSLTTVHQFNVEKGRQAVEMLLGHKHKDSVQLDTELIIRESCPESDS